jgi:DNA-binding transcriptional regulator YdaS (Cro superfamily)
MMTHDTLVRRLLARCAKSSQKAFALQLGISPSYLSDVIAGRREPGPAVLSALGVERIVRYRPLPKLSDER